jgi:hypothetical protein
MAWLAEAFERRSHPRLRRPIPCRVQVPGQCRRGVVRDLSAGGLCVETQLDLPPDTPVVVALDLPVGEPLLLKGSTRRARPAALSLARVAPTELLVRLHEPSHAYLRWLEANASGSES